MRPRNTATPRQYALEKIALSTPNPTLTELLFREPPTNPRPEFVPCYEWRFGTSSGRPICRPPGVSYPRHPIVFYWGEDHTRHQRICATRKCCNPWHFVFTPRPPTMIQHALVFEAEDQIDRFSSLEAALKGIDVPPHYVLQAFRHKRQLNLSKYESPE